MQLSSGCVHAADSGTIFLRMYYRNKPSLKAIIEMQLSSGCVHAADSGTIFLEKTNVLS
jgi:hypothetical protein